MEKILIVVDMQNDFINGVLGSPEAQAIVPKVCEKIEEWKSPYMLYTLDTHEQPFYQVYAESRFVPYHCERDSEGWRLHPHVLKAMSAFKDKDEDNHLIEEAEKDTFGSFEAIELIREDIKNSEFEIHIVGLCTDICVISNALMLRAAFPYAKIIVDAACCAGSTILKHKMALEIMKSNCIEVIHE